MTEDAQKGKQQKQGDQKDGLKQTLGTVVEQKASPPPAAAQRPPQPPRPTQPPPQPQPATEKPFEIPEEDLRNIFKEGI